MRKGFLSDDGNLVDPFKIKQKMKPLDSTALNLQARKIRNIILQVLLDTNISSETMI